MRRLATTACWIAAVLSAAVLVSSFWTRGTVSIVAEKTCLNNAEWREAKSSDFHVTRGSLIVSTHVSAALPSAGAWLIEPEWSSTSCRVSTSFGSPHVMPVGGYSKERRHWVEFIESDEVAARVPFWPVPLSLLGMMAFHYGQRVRRSRLLRRNLCVVCGYDLRASPTCCPECGRRRS